MCEPSRISKNIPLGVVAVRSLDVHNNEHAAGLAANSCACFILAGWIKVCGAGGQTHDPDAAGVGNADDVARVLAMAPGLRGIVHAAGVLDDGMLMHQSAERFTKVAGPKVDGAWHLHSQTLNLSLDFFVMFSSVASCSSDR